MKETYEIGSVIIVDGDKLELYHIDFTRSEYYFRDDNNRYYLSFELIDVLIENGICKIIT